MKLYSLIWRHPSGGRPFVFWSHDKSTVKYQGHLRAEYTYGLSKDQFAELPGGTVQEVDVPTENAEALARWLNAELGESKP